MLDFYEIKKFPFKRNNPNLNPSKTDDTRYPITIHYYSLNIKFLGEKANLYKLIEPNLKI